MLIFYYNEGMKKVLIIFEIFLLLLGFVLLIKSSDLFVDSISSLAINFKMSKMAVAMTVAAFATCAPELAISFHALMSNAGDIAISNVLGSSIVNILLIIGVSAFCYPIKVKEEIIKKEALILLVISVLFSFSMADNILYSVNNIILTRANTLLFLLLFIVFIFYILSQIKITRSFFEREKPKYKLPSSIILSVFCVCGIILGSNIVVEFATELANTIGISQKIITMTVIVIGTSLPELSMTLISAKKHEYDIAIGNIIGTNIFNIGIVLALPILIFGNVASISFNLIDIFVVLLSAILFYIFAKNDKVLTRREGFIMVVIFISYYIYLFLQ